MATLKRFDGSVWSEVDLGYVKPADLTSVSMSTTTGSETITIGSSTLNVVTKNTAQTISATKTFSSSPILNNAVYLKGKDSGGNAKNIIAITSANNVVINNENVGNTLIGGTIVAPITANSETASLGGTSNLWKNLFLCGFIGSGANASYGLALPSTSGWTANKTIATTDDINNIEIPYTTTAPSSANASGKLKVVVLSSEPATKYSGYLYIITEE